MKFKKEKPKVKKEKPVLKPRKSKPSEVKSGPKPMGGEQLAAVSSLIEKVSKKYKDDGLLHRMGDVAVSKVGFVPSGAIGLDYALGIGGYPRGRIIEIYGPEASGKTTLTLHAIAECQKAGGVAAFIDAEHALDMDYAGKLGIDVDNLLFCQPDYGEQALDIVDDIIKENIVDLIVVDSVAALTPKAEIDAEMEKNHVGLQARMLSQALRKITANANKTKTSVAFINQIRQKIGVTFGSNETTPGGNALKFYASVRVDVRRIATLKKGDAPYGNRVRAKIVKNKVAPPYKTAEFDIIWGYGINNYGSVLDLAIDYGLIDKSGAWFSYNGESIGQGRENSILWLKENEDKYKEIYGYLHNDLFGAKEESKSVGEALDEVKEE